MLLGKVPVSLHTSLLFLVISGQVDWLNCCLFLYFILYYSTLALNFDHFNNPLRNAFKHELTLLERVRHPNVVQFVGAVTQNIPMMIVREHHAKVSLPSLSLQSKFLVWLYLTCFSLFISTMIFQGDLAGYLQMKGRLSPSKVLRFAHDVARQVTVSRNYIVWNLCECIPFLNFY